MRRRLQKFLPVVLLALAVQILAPIASCWAAAMAASDPLGGAEICLSDPAAAPGHDGQGGSHQAHDNACSICCLAQASASAEPAPSIFVTLQRRYQLVSWLEAAPTSPTSRVGSNAQARAPPSVS